MGPQDTPRRNVPIQEWTLRNGCVLYAPHVAPWGPMGTLRRGCPGVSWDLPEFDICYHEAPWGPMCMARRGVYMGGPGVSWGVMGTYSPLWSQAWSPSRYVVSLGVL